MEAIAALGVASNIVQFVQTFAAFSSRLWRIYEDGNNNVGHLEGLTVVSEELRDLLPKFTLSDDQRTLLKDQNNTVELSRRCSTTLKKLLSSLDRINGSASANGRKRDAFIIACKATWNQASIREMQAEVNEFRSQLVLNLLVTMRFVTYIFCFFHASTHSWEEIV